jgi:hypothetical protein
VRILHHLHPANSIHPCRPNRTAPSQSEAPSRMRTAKIGRARRASLSLEILILIFYLFLLCRGFQISARLHPSRIQVQVQNREISHARKGTSVLPVRPVYLRRVCAPPGERSIIQKDLGLSNPSRQQFPSNFIASNNFPQIITNSKHEVKSRA